VPDAFADKGFGVAISQSASITAKRWTVLHELGHYYRHIDKDDPFPEVMNYDPSGLTLYIDEKIESEAHAFAEAVLFGGNVLEAAVSLYGPDVNRLCRLFGVSPKVCKIALARRT
jgi:Zn-dependent peptidase ImmA (M78 family)